jgi:hypothetical protein
MIKYLYKEKPQKNDELWFHFNNVNTLTDTNLSTKTCQKKMGVGEKRGLGLEGCKTVHSQELKFIYFEIHLLQVTAIVLLISEMYGF